MSTREELAQKDKLERARQKARMRCLKEGTLPPEQASPREAEFMLAKLATSAGDLELFERFLAVVVQTSGSSFSALNNLPDDKKIRRPYEEAMVRSATEANFYPWPDLLTAQAKKLWQEKVEQASLSKTWQEVFLDYIKLRPWDRKKTYRLFASIVKKRLSSLSFHRLYEMETCTRSHWWADEKEIFGKNTPREYHAEREFREDFTKLVWPCAFELMRERIPTEHPSNLTPLLETRHDWAKELKPLARESFEKSLDRVPIHELLTLGSESCDQEKIEEELAKPDRRREIESLARQDLS